MKKLDQQYKERLRNAGKLSNIWRQNTLCFASDASTPTVFGADYSDFGVLPALVCFVRPGENCSN